MVMALRPKVALPNEAAEEAFAEKEVEAREGEGADDDEAGRVGVVGEIAFLQEVRHFSESNCSSGGMGDGEEEFLKLFLYFWAVQLGQEDS